MNFRSADAVIVTSSARSVCQRPIAPRRATKTFLLTIVCAIGMCLLPLRSDALPILWSGNGHYYDLITTPTTWTAALAAADAATYDPGTGVLDGYLVTITSSEEDTFLNSQYGSQTGFWMAATDQAVEGTWRWVAGPESGTLLSFTNWAPGEPNDGGGFGSQDYGVASFFFAPGKWDDQTNAEAPHPYVIEYSGQTTAAVPEPTSLLLLGTGLIGAGVRRYRQRR